LPATYGTVEIYFDWLCDDDDDDDDGDGDDDDGFYAVVHCK